MLSRTEKARQVRKYYISIETLLRQYYETINEKINQELGLVKNNQKGKTYDKGGYVYVLPAQNTSNKKLKKLGATSGMSNRMNVYNSGNANNVQPLFVMKVDDPKRVEACVKNLIKGNAYREGKEVYEIDIDLLKQVCNKCSEIVSAYDVCSKKMKDRKGKLLICFDKETSDKTASVSAKSMPTKPRKGSSKKHRKSSSRRKSRRKSSKRSKDHR
jgi:hypothetical protein